MYNLMCFAERSISVIKLQGFLLNFTKTAVGFATMLFQKY